MYSNGIVLFSDSVKAFVVSFEIMVDVMVDAVAVDVVGVLVKNSFVKTTFDKGVNSAFGFNVVGFMDQIMAD